MDGSLTKHGPDHKIPTKYGWIARTSPIRCFK